MLLFLVLSAFALSRPLFEFAGAILILSVTITVLLFFLFSIEQTCFSLVYVIGAFNFLILSLSIFITDTRPSYLTTDDFLPYYIDVLFLELVFWAALGIFRYMCHFRFAQDRRSILVPLPLVVCLLAITLLGLEIVINAGGYFRSYVEDSNIGTPLYEVAAIILAVVIFSRPTILPSKKILFSVEMIAVLLVMYVALGSGKRLALSFIVVAYLSQISSKKNIVLLYSLFLFVGYLHGIVRDSLELGGVSLSTIAEGILYTNQGGAFHAAAVYLRIVDEQIVDVFERLTAFISTFVGSLFIPVSILPDITQMNVFAMAYYPVQGNGGLVGAYSWLYLGYVGPVVFALLLALLTSLRQRLFLLISAITIMASMRWMLYNLAPLVRLIGYVVPVFYLMYLILYSSRNHKAVSGMNIYVGREINE